MAHDLAQLKQREGRWFVQRVYNEEMLSSGLGQWYGPFDNVVEAQEYLDSGDWMHSYVAGCSPWKVGYLVRYTGPPQTFHTYQRVVNTGELARISRDNGFDYRFTYEMVRDGMKVRPGSGQFRRVFSDECHSCEGTTEVEDTSYGRLCVHCQDEITAAKG